ncbi:hypothetical protein BTUL_0457g00010 [Botrytis tulipae]|uniref:Beta-lactamase-related domain-containing protein n=1 Tax=Botrytis tulipae TaxID=87230 RepID=A0A4Z1E4F9_9HELO|nr:hypothetical protein BTUL_0457g00010 [Botrytis tulipae]
MEKRIHGYADPKSTELLEVFQDYLKTGEELGASIVVNMDGENVVDVWGGFRTQDKTENWEHDTIFSFFSTKKTICALALIILIDRGILNISDKCYKARKTRTMMEARISIWLSCVDLRVSRRPIVRKTTGKTLKDLVANEIAGALGVDFEIGASAKNCHRISPLVFPASKASLAQTDTSSISAKTFVNPPLDPSVVDSPDWREAEFGSGNGYGNVLSIATILSCISLGGEANGVRLLLNETIDLIFQEQSKEIDLVTGQNLRFGIGFGLSGNDTELKWLPEGRVCM